MYRKCIDNVDRYSSSLLGPSFVNIFPRSTHFQKSLCGYWFSVWNKPPVDHRKIVEGDKFADELKKILYLELDYEANEVHDVPAAIEDLPSYMRRT